MRLTLLRLLARFWAWLGGEELVAETGVIPQPGPDQFVYVVQPGDTLRGVARRFGTSVWILADLNNLDDFDSIRLGYELLVPRSGVSSPSSPVPRRDAQSPVESESGPVIYIVQTGDTLGTIAQRFGVTLDAIIRANRIQNPDVIRSGQRLLIPAPELDVEAEPSLPSTPEPEPPPPPSIERPASPLLLPGLEPVPKPPPAPQPPPGSPVKPRPKPVSRPRTERPVSRRVYVTQPGDSLMSIARRFNATMRDIIEANSLDDFDSIQPGIQLVVPGPAPLTGVAPSHVEPEAPVSSWPEDATRAVYLSSFASGDEARRRQVAGLLDETEINAVVIDFKNGEGLISYPTRVSLAQEIGADRLHAVPDFDELMNFFQSKQVYTIARIVTFKDNLFANAYPQWAARRQAGGLWHDCEGMAWADPFVLETWKYNADIAEEAARRGFDEILFDDVRFPTTSHEGTPCFSQPPSRKPRVRAIAAFLGYVRGRLSPLGVQVAAAVLGYTCWRQDDALVGQSVEHMAPYLDVLCPVLYPSAFDKGIPGYRHVEDHPYEVVCRSTKRVVDRIQSTTCRVRPWIEDIDDASFEGQSDGVTTMQVQVRASLDGGGSGYLFRLLNS